MKFTNSYNLPQSLVDALVGDTYDLKGSPDNILSVTQIIAPPKIKELERRHDDEIEVDVSESLWRMFGTACHNVVESATKGERLSEERWYIDLCDWSVYTAPVGVKATACPWYNKDHFYVSGKTDLYDLESKRLEDYKVMSVWSWIIEKDLKPEHIQQLNMNAYAIRKIGFPVDYSAIVMMFRDWSASKAKYDYPDLPIPMKEVKAPNWNEKYTEDFITDRVKLHLDARTKVRDEDIPECSPFERWARPSQWAVKKHGVEKAKRVHDTEEMAKTHVSQDPSLYIEERKGKNARCEGYCNVTKWCHYYNANYKDGVMV